VSVSKAVGAIKMIRKAIVKTVAASLCRSPSVVLRRRYNGCAATAIMAPQMIVVIKGSTILKHQMVIMSKRPIRIVASNDLLRKT
jgi:hypothetical protein